MRLKMQTFAKFHKKLIFHHILIHDELYIFSISNGTMQGCIKLCFTQCP